MAAQTNEREGKQATKRLTSQQPSTPAERARERATERATELLTSQRPINISIQLIYELLML